MSFFFFFRKRSYRTASTSRSVAARYSAERGCGQQQNDPAQQQRHAAAAPAQHEQRDAARQRQDEADQSKICAHGRPPFGWRGLEIIAPAVVFGVVAPAVAGIGPRIVVVVIFVAVIPAGVVGFHVFAGVVIDIAVGAVADELVLIAVPVPDVAVLVVPVVRRAVVAGIAGVGGLGGHGLGRGAPAGGVGEGGEHVAADVEVVADAAFERDGRGDEGVARRAVIPDLHAAAYRLGQIAGEDVAVEPHIAGQAVIVAVILEVRAEGLDEIAAVHALHEVVEHLDHVGLRGGRALSM